MPEHYTKNTVSVMAYCRKCSKTTDHRVTGGRKGACLECVARRDAEHRQRRPAPAKQEGLF